MRIYALDSTAQTASVALCEDEKLIGLFSVNNGNTHSTTLLPMTKELFDQNGISADDVDVFACSAGPGSFTGVRIGVSAIKGLAFGKNKACIGVSTLEALAYNLLGASCIVCPVMNARRGQVYNAIFRVDEGNVERLCPDRAISISELDAEIAEKYPDLSVVLCGDGADMTSALMKAPHTVASEMLKYQSAYSVAQCALKMYREGARGTDVELTPIYLRLPQAERERLERERGIKN